ncbi:MAG TPA: ATP-binding protein [Chryseosolibacter sp.]|nr:ATP-binding protein [Chryseosolibacter sp.]
MLSNTKFFTAVYLLVSISTSAFAQQDLTWYRSFFKNNSVGSLAKHIEAAESKLKTSDMNPAEKAFLHKELALNKLTARLDYEQAIKHLIAAMRIEDSLSLSQEKIYTYLAKAEILKQVLDFRSANDALEEAYKVNANTNNENDIAAYILLKQGEIAAEEGSMDHAKDYHINALSFREEITDASIVGDILYQQAELLRITGNNEEALKAHIDVLRFRRKSGLRGDEAASLLAIGDLYLINKNEEKALANFYASLEVRQLSNIVHGRAECFNSIGNVYFRQQRYDSALNNLFRGLKLARELNDYRQSKTSYELISNCYRAVGDFNNALKYHDEYTNMLDFIYRDVSEQVVVSNESRAAITKNENTIGQLRNEKNSLEESNKRRLEQLAKEKEYRTILLGFIGLSTIIMVLILYMYFSKRRSNKKLRAINETVKEQNLQLQELNATKDKFFSIISHDLKGPLNSLTSFSGLLINHTDSLSKEEIQVLAKDLDKSLKNLFALLENLLEWSRSQTGNIEFHPEAFDLADLLKINQQLLQMQASSKNISIVNLNDRPLPVTVHKHSVNTVIRNLVSNAIKFTGAGGKVSLSVKDDENFLRVSVADNGVGISPAVMEKLFRIDSKVTTKGTAEEKGTGLGLILCKEFIEKNGGRIWVESEIGKGTVFHFTVPKSKASMHATV